METKLRLIDNDTRAARPTRRTSALSWPREFLAVRAAQLALGLLGVLFFAWAFADARFRAFDGFPTAPFCLPISMGIASIVVALTLASQLRRFGLWAGLGLLGQAVNLQLVDAGPLLHYQHLKTPGQLLSGDNIWLAVFLGFQTLVVLFGFRRYRQSTWDWLRRKFKAWQLVAFAAVLVLPSVAVSRDLSAYVPELFLAGFIQIINLGAVYLMVRALPDKGLDDWRSRIVRIFGNDKPEGTAEPGGLDRFAVAAAVWVTLAAACFAFVSYEQHPHVPDEVAYLYQARFIAAGVTTLPAPPVPAAFDFYLMQFSGSQWYPSTPPGWPAILALGVRAGVPGLVNPLLAGISTLLIYMLVRELYDLRTTRLAVLLLSVSPWFLFMSMNLMTHTFTLTCAIAGALLVAWSRRKNNWVWAFLGGAMVGVGSLIRPLDGLLAALLIGLWVVGVGGRRLNIKSIAAFGIGTVLLGAIVLLYNWAYTGKPLAFPLNTYLDEQFGPGRNDIGFGENRGYGWALQPLPGHSPLGGAINTELNLFSLNTELFGWSTGSLLLVALFVLAGKKRIGDYLMLAVCGVTIGTFFFYWYSGGPDFGARYWYLILVPVVVLSVRGLQALQQLLPPEGGSSANNTRVLVAVLALSFFAVVNYLPWRAIDKYHDYELMRPDIVSLAGKYDFGRSLVLVRGDSHPDYTSTAIYNSLDSNSAAPIYAWDRSPEVEAEVVRAFSDRPVWVVNGPTITHKGYEVAAGPLTAGQIPAPELATP